jgi:membrane protein DedA with SNARE-associated domain
MHNVIPIAERHGLLIVFVNVLLSQGGLPLPAVPTLMTVAALARQAVLSSQNSYCIGVVCTMGSAF